MTLPTVFVTAATGTQGGALARHLRKLGWGVHTTTRKPSSPSAQALAAIGVKITHCEWLDQPALVSALSGCQALYLVLMPVRSDPASEPRFTASFLTAARTAGVKQIIYSAAIHIDHLPGFDPTHWSSPFLLARRESDNIVTAAFTTTVTTTTDTNANTGAAGSGFEYLTILRPGTFMTNFLTPKIKMLYPRATTQGIFDIAMQRDSPFPFALTDPEDIAKLATAALSNPEKFHGKDITFCSDLLEVQQVINTLGDVAGRNSELKIQVWDEDSIKAMEDGDKKIMLEIQRITGVVGGLIDAAELGRWGITGTTWRAFLEKEREGVVETFGGL